MWYLETIYRISSDGSSRSLKNINDFINNGLEVRDGEYIYVKYITESENCGFFKIGLIHLNNKLEPGERILKLRRKKAYLYFSDIIMNLKYEPEKIVEYSGRNDMRASFLGYIFNSSSDTTLVYNKKIPNSKELLQKIMKREK